MGFWGGSSGQKVPGADIRFGISRGVPNYIEGINNAVLHVFEIVPTYQDCQELMLSSEPSGMLFAVLNPIGCVRTTEGRLATLQFEQYDPLGSGSALISFIVCEQKNYQSWISHRGFSSRRQISWRMGFGNKPICFPINHQFYGPGYATGTLRILGRIYRY